MVIEEKITVQKNLLQLLENKEPEKLKFFLNDQYPQDLAEAIEHLKEEEKYTCFRLLDTEHASKVLSELNTENQMELLKALGPDFMASVISQMDADDATDLINKLPTEEKDSLLKVLPDPIQQAHVQELIHYPPESAGGIMSTDFLRLRSDMNINIAFDYVKRQAPEYKGQVYYLYVVDNNNKLVGVITLRNLICAPSSDIVANHMSDEVITCNVTDDQETVAKTISKYDLIALPVIDDSNTLKGVVTIDDVVDILSTETTEDIYQGSGISDAFPSDELINGKVTFAVRARLPWLLLTLGGQTVAACIIASFDKTIASIPLAVSFMPLLSGLSGNIGGQTATITVRGLVTGDIDLKDTFKYISHELKVGLLIGLICSVITGFIAYYQHGIELLGLVVAFALTCSMFLGVLLGTIFPILLQYLKKDPATASSPLITTLLDMTTFAIYLSIISNLIKYLR